MAEIERRLLRMKVGLDHRLRRLEARLLPRRQRLERALEEFRKNLAYLEGLSQEGRFSPAHLEPALLREKLRIQQVEKELKEMEERFAATRNRLLAQARTKAARLGATQDMLDRYFPEVKG
ncbi:MAG: hypothetical protein ACUVUP_02410 [Thermaceae bacterium]